VVSAVIGLGACCDLVPEDESSASPGSVSFRVDEFAVLTDGRRVMLHSGERGFAVSGPYRPSAHDPLGGMTAQEIESDVLTTVLPDEEDGEHHPWEWLAALLRRHGVHVRPESLKSVPYRVEFSERLNCLLGTRRI
jgi:hypothetical protein